MKTKKLSEILSRLIDKTMIATGKVNDFTPGSVIRSIYEAVSLELEQYYMLTRQNINWGIEQGVVQAFDFNKREPKRAYGNVTIQFYNPLQERFYIPRGTTFMSTQQKYIQQFENVVDYYVEPGSSEAVIEVFCKEPGVVGNVPEGAIDVISTSSVLVKSVTNNLSFSTGTDEESITELKNRFHLFVESRGRATNKSIEYGTRLVPDIQGVYVYEEVGHVTVYAHDRNGNLSDTLQQDILGYVEDYRPSGIKLSVLPVSKTVVDLNINVTLTNKNRETDTFKSHIEGVVRNYLNGFTVSDNLVMSDLTQVIMNIDDNLIYDCSYEALNGNLLTSPEEIIRAGTINVNFE
ncbi:baseplate J-like protein [Mammaliicoccus phage vB_MscM-PMS3]|nr:baseplate J-like protein [Mammaliicoccus phage vB_MscM-PMS3]